MRRSVAPLVAAFLLAAALQAGCASPDERSGATTEREEIRGGRRIVLKSRLAPRRVTLGDPVVWTLSADMPDSSVPGKLLRSRAAPELDLRAPREPTSEPVRGNGSSSRDGARTLWTWRYDVRGFGLGAIPLPEVRLAVTTSGSRDTLLFPADTLAVDSLTRAATGTVLPDRGAVTPELRPIDYVVAGALALLAILAVVLLVRALRRRRRPLEVPAAPPVPPEERLRREVAALRAEGEPMPRDAFYDRLSLAIRDYAAAVTGITTRDRTTMEIVRDLRATGDVPRDGVDALRRALARADLAKFAKSGGGWDEALDALDTAERLPDRLPPVRPAPQAAESAGTGPAGPPRAAARGG